MPPHDLESRFAQAIMQGGLFAPDDRVLAAVSGGGDSVAMLHLLSAFDEQQDGSLGVHVAHLNHGLRGQDGDDDASFVRELARDLRLPCAIETADVRARAERDGISVEQAARQCRFEFFERTCLRLEIKTVVLAHHADDNAETILQRLVRGTGLRGLGGIPTVRPIRPGSEIRLIRPMLGFRRAELERYLAERGLRFRHDASNDCTNVTRNRLRHQVLPLLREQFNPQVDEALIRLGEQARSIDAYLTETASRMFESMLVEYNDRELVLHCPSLTRKSEVIQAQVIRQAILRLGTGEGELTYGHYRAVVALASERAGTKAVDLPGGLRVTRRYARLVLERTPGDHETGEKATDVCVALEGTTLLPDRGVEIQAVLQPADEATISAHIHRLSGRGRTSQEEWLDAEAVHPPLIARARRPGEKFWPLGMSGMKKLSDFFIDEKIEPSLRERTVVLCDQLGPIWVVPFRIDERVRLTRATRQVLRLSVKSLTGPDARGGLPT